MDKAAENKKERVVDKAAENKKERVDTDISAAAMFARELKCRQARDMEELDRLYKKYTDEEVRPKTEEQKSSGTARKMQEAVGQPLQQRATPNYASQPNVFPVNYPPNRSSMPVANQQMVTNGSNHLAHVGLNLMNYPEEFHGVNPFSINGFNQATTSNGSVAGEPYPFQQLGAMSHQHPFPNIFYPVAPMGGGALFPGPGTPFGIGQLPYPAPYSMPSNFRPNSQSDAAAAANHSERMAKNKHSPPSNSRCPSALAPFQSSPNFNGISAAVEQPLEEQLPVDVKQSCDLDGIEPGHQYTQPWRNGW